MKFTMRGPLRDIVSFGKHLRERNRVFARAESTPLPPGKMNLLAAALHPRVQHLKIDSLREEYPGAFTYRLVPASGGRVANFRAGQYIAVETVVDGNRVSRPYSVCTSPEESRRGNYYEITVKQKQNGYVSTWSVEQWQPGTELICSEPEGHFSYDSLRDSKKLVCLAGGTGITPFRSIITETLSSEPEVHIYLLYGINTASEQLYTADFAVLHDRYGDRFRLVTVCAESGNITAGLIGRTAGMDGDPTVFICGPEAMQDFLTGELAQFSLPRRRVRRENLGTADPGTPESRSPTEPVSILVRGVGGTTRIPAVRGETILTALERAGMNPPARCRSGECGWCRSKLYAGEVRVCDRNDGRRAADRKFSYIHPCSSFPMTDLEIGVPPNPLGGKKDGISSRFSTSA